MSEYLSKNKAHNLFVVGVIAKGLNGFFELIVAFLFFATGELAKLANFLTERELGEDPTDFVANSIKEFLPHLSLSTELFVAWYFLVHGITNIILVISLLRKKIWAYPLAMIVQIFFILYELYRFTHTHSKMLVLISTFDLFLVWLIWREYERVKTLNSQTNILLP